MCAWPETLATQNRFAGISVKSKIVPNQKLAEELHKPVIRKFEKRKVQSSFSDNILGADLVDVQLISKFSKGICFLLCVIYSKYAWVAPLKYAQIEVANVTIDQ